MKKSILALRHAQQNTSLRQARSCYGHLAGVAGVELFENFVELGLFRSTEFRSREPCELTDKAHQTLSFINLDRQKSRRYAYTCPDWTEHGFHLGGLLGQRLLDYLLEEGLVLKDEGRVIRLTPGYTLWCETHFKL